ncbi:MAG: flagellar export protein FliJ [Bdellovibrionales bacterium]|nr:flagellar export protein FliJ [Bdellovibrionales bacterium]
MKFQFRLEKVLKFRSVEVDLAKRDFLAAMVHVDKAKADLVRMEEILTKSIERRFETSKGGGQVVDQLSQVQKFIDGQKIRIKNQAKTLAGFESIAEAKREILKLAVQNEKILEKLKDRKKEQFRIERKKLEIKNIDDLVTSRPQKREQE